MQNQAVNAFRQWRLHYEQMGRYLQTLQASGQANTPQYMQYRASYLQMHASQGNLSAQVLAVGGLCVCVCVCMCACTHVLSLHVLACESEGE